MLAGDYKSMLRREKQSLGTASELTLRMSQMFRNNSKSVKVELCFQLELRNTWANFVRLSSTACGSQIHI